MNILFKSALNRFQSRWRIGLCLRGLLRSFSVLLLGGLFFAVLDFYSGFSDSARLLINRFLGMCTLGAFAYTIWELVGFNPGQAARQADGASARRQVLSALELEECEPKAAAPDSLAHWLQQRVLARAAEYLDGLPNRAVFPIAKLKIESRRLLSLAIIVASCFTVAPSACRLIAQRLWNPSADLPPYSALSFSLSPNPAQVLYGDQILISAEIGGAKIKSPVRCLTRDNSTGKIEQATAFQDNPGRFSFKLEKVTTPVSVAFAVGKARSAWLTIAVRTQPKIEAATLSIIPPTYSGLPRREFAVGTQEVKVLPGSQIAIRVRSNRPLAGGCLRIPRGQQSPEKEIAAERVQTHEVEFKWRVQSAGRLALQIRDALGSDSEPLQFEQKLLQDARPEVGLREPASEVFATPETELPLEGFARDDFGLKRLTLVRQLKGYRERAVPEPITPGRQAEFSRPLNLAPLGLLPGQVLEISLESADNNPNLLGVSVSEPVRVRIIDAEQYASMLRAQTTLEDFAGRYQALHEAMDQARSALDALDQAARTGDAAGAENARKNALEAHQNAGKLFGKIAKDFGLFELDQALSKAALEAMTALYENGQQLQDLWRSQPKELLEALPELKRRLGQVEQRLKPELDKGDQVAAGAKILAAAEQFRELIGSQRELVKDLNRALEQIRRGETKAGQALGDLARRQKDLAHDLRQFERAMKEAVAALPESLAKMKSESEKFLEAFGELEIGATMDEAVQAGEKADSKTAAARSEEALAKLEALLRKKNGFCEMCRGEGTDQFGWPAELAQTLEQLMKALIPKPETTEGEGSSGPKSGPGGQGPGGRSENGYSMRGKMPQLPIYGPSRTRFGLKAGGLAKAEGTGTGSAQGSSQLEKSDLKADPVGRTAGESRGTEAVPEAYREALKRYFSLPEPNHSGATPAP